MSRSFLGLKKSSTWGLRSHRRTSNGTQFYLEHEVTVAGGSSGIEVVARFVHELPGPGHRRESWFHRGGLVGITLRRCRTYNKEIGSSESPKSTLRFRALAISPQSRVAIGGSPSPVAGPLALSVNASSILPMVSASDAAKEDISVAPALPSPAAILPDQPCADINIASGLAELPAEANASETSAWLRAGRFHAFESTFSSFSASDILRLSRDDLIQICGLADGIRLFNALHSKAPTPKLTLYFSVEGSGSLWRVVYLETLTSGALSGKLLATLNLPPDQLHSLLLLGPQGIHVIVSNDLVANMKDESMYFVETIRDPVSDQYKLLLKPSTR